MHPCARLRGGTPASLVLALIAGCSGGGSGGGSRCEPGPGVVAAVPTVFTGRVRGDADDCALWIHPTDAALSLVLGTDKSSGALHAWDLAGVELQRLDLADPNNVDVRQDVPIDGAPADWAVASLRAGAGGLAVVGIDAGTRLLVELSNPTGLPTPEVDEPYGLCLYRRPADAALFALVTSRSGASRGRIFQYRLEGDGAGGARATFVRSLGDGTIAGLVEGLVADDDAGYLYAAEEDVAVHKLAVDPDAGPGTLLASFALDDAIRGDREGLALHSCLDGTGHLLLSSQGDSSIKVYPREGFGGDRHAHPLLLTVCAPDASSSDGLDATSAALGAAFPLGVVVKHDSSGRRFALFAWEAVAAGVLASCPP